MHGYPLGFFGIDQYYIMLVLPALFFAMYAQYKVSSTFKKFSQLHSYKGLSGADVARQILDGSGLHNVKVEHISGDLSDHYDPKANVVRLSDSVYGSKSVAAIGVAAHETGHAIQHSQKYIPIIIRNAFVPVASIGSQAALPLAILGLFMRIPILVTVGIILFTAVVLFQIITLPVEFNASSRAVAILEKQYILDGAELVGAKKVLNAAAMTYVAAAAVALANLLRLLLLSRGRR